ncbi:hypothetical protein Ddye_002336 [Dipteronia dyeriana]|uniref:Uncharacterized protein n=1 Tax=Dipteronia dyeriana TaxID=168575 RepID=A0AAE0CUA6_9ROSI|nr:hypothetical protein Ddye_002336 [Dipteronia dyeriana]
MLRIMLRSSQMSLKLTNVWKTFKMNRIQDARSALGIKHLKIHLHRQNVGLEETPIDLYRSGYNQEDDSANGEMMPLGTDEGDNFKFSADDTGNSDSLELEEVEWIAEDDHGLIHSSEVFLDEGVSCYSWDEDNWWSQYGQVTRSEEEPVLAFPVFDLWDWAMVTECRKVGKGQVARLVEHKVRRSIKLHPSMPSSR